MDISYRSHQPARVTDGGFRSASLPGLSPDSGLDDEDSDSAYELHVEELRRKNDQKLRDRFQSIFAKYSRDFGEASDEIDLVTGEVAVNNGHLEYMRHERDVGPSPLRRSSSSARHRTGRSIALEQDELAPSRPRMRSRTSIHADEHPRPSAFDEYYNNVSKDLAVEVVQNAVPERGQPDYIDQAFLETFNRNIVQQISLVMQTFQTPQTIMSNAHSPQRRIEDPIRSTPIRSTPTRSTPTRTAGLWNSTETATPTRNMSLPSSLWAPRGTPTRWEESLWADESRATPAAYPHSVGRNRRPPLGCSWSKEEDQSIIHYKVNENMSWKQITEKFPDRTQRAVENRFFRLSNRIPALKPNPEDFRRSTRSGSGIDSPESVSDAEENAAGIDEHFPSSHAENSTSMMQNDPGLHIPYGSSTSGDPENASSRRSASLTGDEANPAKLRKSGGKSGKTRQREPSRRHCQEDDELIIHLREDKGLTWREVATHLPGRTRNALCMRYRIYLKPGAPEALYKRTSPELKGTGLQEDEISPDQAPENNQRQADYVSDSDDGGENDLSATDSEEHTSHAMQSMTVDDTRTEQEMNLDMNMPSRKRRKFGTGEPQDKAGYPNTMDDFSHNHLQQVRPTTSETNPNLLYSPTINAKISRDRDEDPTPSPTQPDSGTQVAGQVAPSNSETKRVTTISDDVIDPALLNDDTHISSAAGEKESQTSGYSAEDKGPVDADSVECARDTPDDTPIDKKRRPKGPDRRSVAKATAMDDNVETAKPLNPSRRRKDKVYRRRKSSTNLVPEERTKARNRASAPGDMRTAKRPSKTRGVLLDTKAVSSPQIASLMESSRFNASRSRSGQFETPSRSHEIDAELGSEDELGF